MPHDLRVNPTPTIRRAVFSGVKHGKTQAKTKDSAPPPKELMKSWAFLSLGWKVGLRKVGGFEDDLKSSSVLETVFHGFGG